jgi:hypothetical protein
MIFSGLEHLHLPRGDSTLVVIVLATLVIVVTADASAHLLDEVPAPLLLLAAVTTLLAKMTAVTATMTVETGPAALMTETVTVT